MKKVKPCGCSYEETVTTEGRKVIDEFVCSEHAREMYVIARGQLHEPKYQSSGIFTPRSKPN